MTDKQNLLKLTAMIGMSRKQQIEHQLKLLEVLMAKAVKDGKYKEAASILEQGKKLLKEMELHR